jgi:hypothetical protein
MSKQQFCSGSKGQIDLLKNLTHSSCMNDCMPDPGLQLTKGEISAAGLKAEARAIVKHTGAGEFALRAGGRRVNLPG